MIFVLLLFAAIPNVVQGNRQETQSDVNYVIVEKAAWFPIN